MHTHNQETPEHKSQWSYNLKGSLYFHSFKECSFITQTAVTCADLSIFLILGICKDLEVYPSWYRVQAHTGKVPLYWAALLARHPTYIA